ncbi:MAG TPA: hypothetical protein VFW66_10705 [Gemmatimonadales bacterium]|nr:hypothetical protein [Gemmatimonadales bacterium]
MQTSRSLAAALLAGALVLAACSGDTTAPGPQGRMTMSLASRASGAPSARLASFDITSPTPGTFSDGTNTLVLTRVQVVLRKIELKRTGVSVCADLPMPVEINTDEGSGGGNGSGEAEPGDDHGHDGVEDDCEEAELGPMLLDVPVATAGAEQSISVPLDAGTYDRVEFQIHKPTGSNDAAFLQTDPGFDGVSIHVEGTWNGAPFTFNSAITAVEELELEPPVTLAANGTTDLTVLVDVSQWFSDGAGALIDPSSANDGQPNESRVQQNIQASFHAFEDANEDGRDDHGTNG